MTLGDVAERIVSTEHPLVVVCLENTRQKTVLWFKINLREQLALRHGMITGEDIKRQRLYIDRPQSRLTIQLTSQDAMIEQPHTLASLNPITPMFTAYGAGWAESSLR